MWPQAIKSRYKSEGQKYGSLAQKLVHLYSFHDIFLLDYKKKNKTKQKKRKQTNVILNANMENKKQFFYPSSVHETSSWIVIISGH